MKWHWKLKGLTENVSQQTTFMLNFNNTTCFHLLLTFNSLMTYGIHIHTNTSINSALSNVLFHTTLKDSTFSNNQSDSSVDTRVSFRYMFLGHILLISFVILPIK